MTANIIISLGFVTEKFSCNIKQLMRQSLIAVQNIIEVYVDSCLGPKICFVVNQPFVSHRLSVNTLDYSNLGFAHQRGCEVIEL